MKKKAQLKALSVDEVLTAVSTIIARYLPAARILLFGSRARDDAEPTSDFDFAIDARSKIPLEVIARIEDEIDELYTLKSIDIIDMNRVNHAFKAIILKNGVNIYDRDKSAT
ncbi:MAG: nucleotidyltransferase domain-containing protein [Halobacteriota archaeon]